MSTTLKRPKPKKPRPVPAIAPPKRGHRAADLARLLDVLAPVGQRRPAARDAAQRARELGRVETDYVCHASFADAALAKEILFAEPLTSVAPTSAWKPWRDVPAHLVRMCETALLTPAEERNLFRRMNYLKYRADLLRRRLDPAAVDGELLALVERLLELVAWDRERIVRANLRLVVSIAKKFTNAYCSFDELLSEGITALLRAAEKFDFSRGFRFSTYATQAVRHTLSRLIQHTQRDRTRFLQSEAGLFEDTPEEEGRSTMTEARWEQLRRSLAELLAQLDPRERAIVRRRFGLDGSRDGQTLQSLAAEMGVCKERVRQLESRAIGKLRALAESAQIALPSDSRE